MERVRLRWRDLNQDEHHFFYVDQIKLVGEKASESLEYKRDGGSGEALGMGVNFQREALENTQEWFGALT